MEKEQKKAKNVTWNDSELITAEYNGTKQAMEAGEVKFSSQKAGCSVFVTIDTENPAALLAAARWVRSHYSNVAQIRNSAGEIIYVRTIY